MQAQSPWQPFATAGGRLPAPGGSWPRRARRLGALVAAAAAVAVGATLLPDHVGSRAVPLAPQGAAARELDAAAVAALHAPWQPLADGRMYYTRTISWEPWLVARESASTGGWLDPSQPAESAVDATDPHGWSAREVEGWTGTSPAGREVRTNPSQAYFPDEATRSAYAARWHTTDLQLPAVGAPKQQPAVPAMADYDFPDVNAPGQQSDSRMQSDGSTTTVVRHADGTTDAGTRELTRRAAAAATAQPSMPAEEVEPQLDTHTNRLQRRNWGMTLAELQALPTDPSLLDLTLRGAVFATWQREVAAFEQERVKYGFAPGAVAVIAKSGNSASMYYRPTPPDIDGQVLDTISTLLAQAPLEPAQRFALWKVAARQPKATLAGVVHDRLGRRGTAIDFDTDVRDVRLVIDTDTGELLERRELLAPPTPFAKAISPSADGMRLIESAGPDGFGPDCGRQLPKSIDMVTDYLASGVVDSPDDRVRARTTLADVQQVFGDEQVTQGQRLAAARDRDYARQLREGCAARKSHPDPTAGSGVAVPGGGPIPEPDAEAAAVAVAPGGGSPAVGAPTAAAPPIDARPATGEPMPAAVADKLR